MKNIEQILKDAGVEITDEQKSAINKDVAENYKTVADYNKQVKKTETAEANAETLQTQLNDAQETIKGFDGVDVEKLNKDIADWKARAEKAEQEYSEKLSQRDFEDALKEAISEAKGKNGKAIRALLDMESLMKSKNQKEDIKKALDDLKAAEDSSFLFVNEEAQKEEAAKQKAASEVPKFTDKAEPKQEPPKEDKRPVPKIW